MPTTARLNSRRRSSNANSKQSDSDNDKTHASSDWNPPSGGFLLLNFELPYRNDLALSLRLQHHKVIVPEEHGVSLMDLQDEDIRRADFILFDLTRIDHDTVWLPLRRICRLRKPDGMPLFVHCFSRIHRGEDFHRMVEGLGPRMDYYAE